MKYVLRAYYGFAIFSLLFWAFTGMPLWAPINVKDDFRVIILGIFYLGALPAIMLDLGF